MVVSSTKLRPNELSNVELTERSETLADFLKSDMQWKITSIESTNSKLHLLLVGFEQAPTHWK